MQQVDLCMKHARDNAVKNRNYQFIAYTCFGISNPGFVRGQKSCLARYPIFPGQDHFEFFENLNPFSKIVRIFLGFTLKMAILEIIEKEVHGLLTLGVAREKLD